jgi:chromosome segregation ATPase
MKHDEHIETPTDEGNDAETLRQTVARLEAELAQLNDEYERLNSLKHSSEDPFPVPSTPRLTFLREVLPGLRSQIDTLRDKLSLIDAVKSFERGAAEAPERAQAARQAMVMAEQRRDELTSRAEALRQRAETLRAESAAAGSAATENESRAAQAFAHAISIGDTKMEKSAQADLSKAQSETLAVQTKAASHARVIAALELEAEGLERKAAEAAEEARGHRTEMYGAQSAGLQAQWDEAVSALADVGARLVAIHRHLGYPAGLWRLQVPRFNPAQNWPLTEDDIERRASEIRDEPLTIEETTSASE